MYGSLSLPCTAFKVCTVLYFHVTVVQDPTCFTSREQLTGGLPWWKSTVVYQVYPHSFQDSDGNGIGDLNGIAQRLNYLQYLGVGTIWLNPIYPSPLVDMGYDVADYTDINPLYGTLDDFKQLLDSVHGKGMKLLMDFVPNHTSDQHPWFVESRSNCTNPKRDWYIWVPPKGYTTDGSPIPPNNWHSSFVGSMWEYDEATKEYYLHQYAKQQPDLNFRNPEVVNALDDVLHFWLNLGVDGFRVDAVSRLYEDPLLRDEEVHPNQTQIRYGSFHHNYTRDYPEIHTVVRRWRKLLDSYGERLMIGEIYSDPTTVMSYFGSEEEPEFSYPFNFFLLKNPKWTGNSVANVIAKWLDNQPAFGWPNWVLGNHDSSRIATNADPQRSRLLNVLLLLLPGTPTTYYGEELGMENVDVPKHLRRDPKTHNPRDQERTPMMWNCSTHAGFTTPETQPWLPLPSQEVINKVNVEAQKARPQSMLNLFRTLVELRSHPEFQYGAYKVLNVTECTLVFLRYHENIGLNVRRWSSIVAINFCGEPQTVSVGEEKLPSSDTVTLILSSYMDHKEEVVSTKSMLLRPYEAVVMQEESDKCAL